jgi:hypothetical protein
MDPRGPFPPELFAEPEIVDTYKSALDEDGSSFPLGATAQNSFNPPKHVRCALCLARVLESEKDQHICED